MSFQFILIPSIIREALFFMSFFNWLMIINSIEDLSAWKKQRKFFGIKPFHTTPVSGLVLVFKSRWYPRWTVSLLWPYTRRVWGLTLRDHKTILDYCHHHPPFVLIQQMLKKNILLIFFKQSHRIFEIIFKSF